MKDPALKLACQENKHMSKGKGAKKTPILHKGK